MRPASQAPSGAAGGPSAAVRELVGLLGPEARPEVRRAAAGAAAGLTGEAAGRRLLAEQEGAVGALVALLTDAGAEAGAAGEAGRALVNLAAEPEAAAALRPALPALLARALQPAHPLAAPAAAALANATRPEAAAGHLLSLLLRPEGGGLAPLVDALCAPPGAAAEEAPHGLAPLLANLSRLPDTRAALLRGPRCLLQRLLPYTQDAASALRRRGVVATLRNCCFDYEHHQWLLSDQVDVLPFLLLPLAGPEEFPEDEMEKLPLDLQYLPPEKQREPDPDIRKMLLETVLLLTATKPGRQLVREKGTYFILRELHKWEADPSVLAACEKVVQVLIADEPESGMENLLEVEVPAEVEEQLQRLDREEEQRERPAPGSQAPQG